jgi:hypothetical protein
MHFLELITWMTGIFLPMMLEERKPTGSLLLPSSQSVAEILPKIWQ